MRDLKAIDSLVATQREVLMQLQEYATHNRQRCLCGYAVADIITYNVHRSTCVLLRTAIVGDVVRVANLLGKTPTIKEYVALRLDSLPSWSTANQLIFDSWNELITEARLTPNAVYKKGES